VWVLQHRPSQVRETWPSQSGELHLAAPSSTSRSHWNCTGASEPNAGTGSQRNQPLAACWQPSSPSSLPAESGVPPRSPHTALALSSHHQPLHVPSSIPVVLCLPLILAECVTSPHQTGCAAAVKADITADGFSFVKAAEPDYPFPSRGRKSNCAVSLAHTSQGLG